MKFWINFLLFIKIALLLRLLFWAKMLREIIYLNYDSYYSMNSHFGGTSSYWRGMFSWELLFKHAAVIDMFLLWSHTCAMCGYQFLLPSFSNSEFIPCNQSPQQSCVLWRLALSHAECPVPTLCFIARNWELMSCACYLGCPTLPAQIQHHRCPFPHTALNYPCPWTSGPFPQS